MRSRRHVLAAGFTALVVLLAAVPAGAQNFVEELRRLRTEVETLKTELDKLSRRPAGQGSPGPQGPPGAGVDTLKGISFANGAIGLEGQKGNRVAYIGEGATPLGGYAEFNTEAGQRHVFIGTSGGPGGFASFFNNEAKELAYIGATKGGLGGAISVGTNTSPTLVRIYTSGELGMMEMNGRIVMRGQQTGDYAELFEMASREGAKPGTVLGVGRDGGGLRPTAEAYSPGAVGVISGAGTLSPGIVIGGRADGSTDLPVAIMGQVYVRVCAEGGAIQPGDLLVSSSTPGVAMVARDPAQAFGAVIGKALTAWTAGDSETEGLVRMLVMSR